MKYIKLILVSAIILLSHIPSNSNAYVHGLVNTKLYGEWKSNCSLASYGEQYPYKITTATFIGPHIKIQVWSYNNKFCNSPHKHYKEDISPYSVNPTPLTGYEHETYNIRIIDPVNEKSLGRDFKDNIISINGNKFNLGLKQYQKEPTEIDHETTYVRQPLNPEFQKLNGTWLSKCTFDDDLKENIIEELVYFESFFYATSTACNPSSSETGKLSTVNFDVMEGVFFMNDREIKAQDELTAYRVDYYSVMQISQDITENHGLTPGTTTIYIKLQDILTQELHKMRDQTYENFIVNLIQMLASISKELKKIPIEERHQVRTLIGKHVNKFMLETFGFIIKNLIKIDDHTMYSNKEINEIEEQEELEELEELEEQEDLLQDMVEGLLEGIREALLDEQKKELEELLNVVAEEVEKIGKMPTELDLKKPFTKYVPATDSLKLDGKWVSNCHYSKNKNVNSYVVEVLSFAGNSINSIISKYGDKTCTGDVISSIKYGGTFLVGREAMTPNKLKVFKIYLNFISDNAPFVATNGFIPAIIKLDRNKFNLGLTSEDEDEGEGERVNSPTEIDFTITYTKK